MVKINYTKEQWNDDVNKVVWKDIIVSAGDSNLVSNRKDSLRSRLIGIRRIDDGVECVVPTINIITDVLRNIGIGLKIPSSRTMNKIKLANAFVIMQAKMERLEIRGLVEEVDDDGSPVRLCVKRYLNVLFGPVVKVKLATRGASLNKAQLQERLATDQEFHTELLHEYNNESKYNEHVWVEIEDFQDASDFQPIAPRLWRKSDAKLKELTSEYEHKIRACTKLGFHGNFEDLDEEKLGKTSPAMQYLHRNLVANPAPEKYSTPAGPARSTRLGRRPCTTMGELNPY